MTKTQSIQTIGTITVRGITRAAYLLDGQVYYFGSINTRTAKAANIEQAATFEPA